MFTKIHADIETRVESGALQINDDFPGLFIRGDDSFSLKLALEHMLELDTIHSELFFDRISIAVIKRVINIIDTEVILK